MAIGRRLYWALALVALLILAGAAVTATAHLTSAGGPTPTPAVQASGQQDEADDASESATKGPDTDAIEEQSGDQNEADSQSQAEDAAEPQQSGVLDDGNDLLPQAGITLDQAIAAAQSAASGPLGEVDLENYQGKLVFNVDVGDKDVKVDANTGAVLSADSTD
jgi:uncharacterized membrane protein YkoI